MTTQSPMLSVETLAQLLREAEQAHGAYERQLGHRDDDWPTWYARHMLGPLQQLLAGGARTPVPDAAAPAAGAS
jgi:hypothetical protein